MNEANIEIFMSKLLWIDCGFYKKYIKREKFSRENFDKLLGIWLFVKAFTVKLLRYSLGSYYWQI